MLETSALQPGFNFDQDRKKRRRTFKTQAWDVAAQGEIKAGKHTPDLYGSRCSAVSMTELPVGEERWIHSA
jgi:hypothetical protein